MSFYDRRVAKILMGAEGVETKSHEEAIIVGSIAASLRELRRFDVGDVLRRVRVTSADAHTREVIKAPMDVTAADLKPYVAAFNQAYQAAVLP